MSQYNKHCKGVFPVSVMALFKCILTSTYFSYNGQFSEQTEGVAMGSPLSSIVVDFVMECFEKHALEEAPLKPALYKRYIDDTLVIWPRGFTIFCSPFEFVF